MRTLLAFVAVACIAAIVDCQCAFAFDQHGDQSQLVHVDAELVVDTNMKSGELLVTAKIQDGYHIYAMKQAKPFLATQISVDQSSGVSVSGEFVAQTPAKRHHEPELNLELWEHEGQVQWRAPVVIQDERDANNLKVSGCVFAQACSSEGCSSPAKYQFVTRVTDEVTSSLSVKHPASSRSSQNSSQQPHDEVVTANSESYNELALDFSQIDVQANAANSAPLMVILSMALLAGFILNFMPCVLPVIGLKVMAFAQQAGDSRTRVFALNLSYALGIISFFIVLATMAVFLGMGWGQQFSSVTFNIVLASVVFMFALSFLGVWEIPIPGFVGTGGANDLAQKEGAGGAFSKGVLTTVLATPCSGPLLGAALTWAVTQPPILTYLVFVCVGLGMASPYLLLGAFPSLLTMIPKPGNWMITFKQVMGLMMLATVVYVLSFIPIPYVLPMVAFMVALLAACWWIGRVPMTAGWDTQGSAWVQAGAFALVVGFVSFGGLHRIMESRFQHAVDRELASRRLTVDGSNVASGHSVASTRDNTELSWQPYSHAALMQHTGEGKTVLVDFTADWCLTCKANEAIALNTSSTKRFIEANDIVTLKADKTQDAPEVDELLLRLGNKSRSIPFYAIFPARRPNKPILLDGLFASPEPILSALEKGGPSQRIVQQRDRRFSR